MRKWTCPFQASSQLASPPVSLGVFVLKPFLPPNVVPAQARYVEGMYSGTVV
jgi:hypothetical protein